jgi:hypothetical protein
LAGAAIFRVHRRSGFVSKIRTSSPGAVNGSGRSSTAPTTLKTAVPAPMPIASVAIATSEYAGLLRSVRAP